MSDAAANVTMPGGRAAFVPRTAEVTRPYWEATRERRLLLQRCRSCGRLVHHPREACPACLGLDLDWVESAGTGVVHARSVHQRPFEAMTKADCPYVVAFVDLDDGVRFLSNIVGAERQSVVVGDRVQLAWEPIGAGLHLPVFELVRG